MRAAAIVASCALLVVISVCGRGEAPAPAERIVASVSGRPLTAAEVGQSAARGVGEVAPEAALERAIATRLAADEARRRGLQAAQRDRSQTDDQAMQQALYEATRDQLEFSDAELRAHYEKTAARYVSRQVVLRRQVFSSEAEARAAGPLAGGASERIGPAPADQLPVDVLPEALTLTSAGQRVVLARDGRFALLELAEIRDAEPLAFELVRPKVEQSLRLLRAQSAYRDELTRLRREAEIEISKDALAER